MKQMKDKKKGRRGFLTTAATTVSGAGVMSGASGDPGRIHLGSVRMIDLSVAIENDAAAN